MPLSFHFFKIISLPQEPRFETQEQLTLLDDQEDNMEACKSVVQLENRDLLPGIARYHVTHEFIVRLEYPGRARKIIFKEFVSPYHFPMFHPHGDSAHSDSLIVRTKGKVAHDFIKRMNGSHSGFNVEPREIDFERLRPLVASMKGAWFKDMKAANVTSTGLFGPRVDKSSEFKHAENIGTLNAVLTNYPFEEVAYTIMITGSGGLVLYDNFETDETALPLVDEIRINFLENSWAEATDKRRGKKIKGTD